MSRMNREQALEKLGGDVELLSELGGVFNEEYPGMLVELHRAVKANDSRRVYDAAHRLKGAVSIFCADSVVRPTIELELMGRMGQLSGADESLATLVREIEMLATELGTELRC